MSGPVSRVTDDTRVDVRSGSAPRTAPHARYDMDTGNYIQLDTVHCLNYYFIRFYYYCLKVPKEQIKTSVKLLRGFLMW